MAHRVPVERLTLLVNSCVKKQVPTLCMCPTKAAAKP